jgi:hypothetical protein
MAKDARQYRLIVRYPDREVTTRFYAAERRLLEALQSRKRSHGARYLCQEWTIGSLDNQFAEMVSEREV